jgi:hypothetical protein
VIISGYVEKCSYSSEVHAGVFHGMKCPNVIISCKILQKQPPNEAHNKTLIL